MKTYRRTRMKEPEVWKPSELKPLTRVGSEWRPFGKAIYARTRYLDIKKAHFLKQYVFLLVADYIVWDGSHLDCYTLYEQFLVNITPNDDETKAKENTKKQYSS